MNMPEVPIIVNTVHSKEKDAGDTILKTVEDPSNKQGARLAESIKV
jgi:hypothetical protein